MPRPATGAGSRATPTPSPPSDRFAAKPCANGPRLGVRGSSATGGVVRATAPVDPVGGGKSENEAEQQVQVTPMVGVDLEALDQLDEQARPNGDCFDLDGPLRNVSRQPTNSATAVKAT